MAYVVGQHHSHLPDVVLGIDGAQPVGQKTLNKCKHVYFIHQNKLCTYSDYVKMHFKNQVGRIFLELKHSLKENQPPC